MFTFIHCGAGCSAHDDARQVGLPAARELEVRVGFFQQEDVARQGHQAKQRCRETRKQERPAGRLMNDWSCKCMMSSKVELDCPIPDARNT